MLQIGSGKLYQNGVGRENLLRGVIYSNLSIFGEHKIETVAGSILPTSYLNNSLSLVYEFSEFMEKQEIAPSVIVSHGIEPYISDFSAILSFALNCVATPDNNLANRLLGEQRGLSTPAPPKKIVSRFFDNQIVFKPDDEKYLCDFIKQLIGLERRCFLGVMRAIRTYITGMLRIGDDLELAYTLIVASIESLAQDFDGHKANWDDFDQRRRKKIDTALNDAEEDVKKKVRTAILEIEHTALSRRFRSFSIEHVNSSFFREEAVGIASPIAKSDLPSVLNQAYKARSKYVHNLRELPRNLKFGNLSCETLRIDKVTWLTLQGLSRLARHVIIEFINKQPTVDSESYDYHLERTGIIQAPLAPQYWIGNVHNITRECGPKRLEGFLQQLTPFLFLKPDYQITDLTPVLEVVESMLPQFKKCERLPFIALYLLFNGFLPEEQKMKGVKEFENKYGNEITQPSSEALIYILLFDLKVEWELSIHKDTIDNYFNSRDNKLSFRLPRALEAGILLNLAERYRLDGQFDEAKKYVELSLENMPENKQLSEFESNYKFHCKDVITWSEIIFPKSEDKEQVEDA